MRGGPGGGGGVSLDLEAMGESVNTTLSDGMQGKLREAARHFEYDSEEVDKDYYAFRPDVSFKTGMTYEPKVCKVHCMWECCPAHLLIACSELLLLFICVSSHEKLVYVIYHFSGVNRSVMFNAICLLGKK